MLLFFETNEEIEFLREHLHLPPEIVTVTLDEKILEVRAHGPDKCVSVHQNT